jgi:hypothetical protein
VSIRRLAAAATTVLVAFVVALAVPVSQLRTFAIQTSCCCPDPAHCHCPDHAPDHGNGSSMRACHKTAHEIVSPVAPAFAAPDVVIATAPARALSRTAWTIAEPHAAPAPARPAAPS